MKIYESIIIVLLLVQIGLMVITIVQPQSMEKMAKRTYIETRAKLLAMEDFEFEGYDD